MEESAQYQMEQSPQWPPRRRQQDRRAHDGCPECGGVEIEEGFCTACGLEVESILLSTEPEWRAFDLEQREKRTRVGAPYTQTIHDKGLSTNISRQNIDAHGRKLYPEEIAKMYRLRKWDQRSKVSDSTQKNLVRALSDMSRISEVLNLPRNVVEGASVIYRKALDKNLIRGRTISSVVAASVYMSCRRNNVIRTLDDVADAANITKKECARNYRFLFRELKPYVPRPDVSSHGSQIINKLNLPGTTELVLQKIIEAAKAYKFTSGRGPSGIVAAMTYISTVLTDEKRTQKIIAKEAQTTEVTIRNRYKEFMENFDITVYL